MELTQVAETVLKNRYYLKDEEGKVLEDWGKLCTRVANFVAKDNDVQAQKFFKIIHELDFLPNSPCLMNAGTSIGQLSACFVLPVEDSMEGIFEAIKNGAIVHKTGGGTGYSFSDLRSKGAAVQSTSGVASGPLSFAKVFDAATETIKQGGRRRGANMGVLRVDHPNIIDFIQAKQVEGEFKNFNFSVALTDDFMRAVKNNEEYDLIDPKSGFVRKENARKVFDLIVQNAWKNGEPGVLFIDTANRANTVPQLGKFKATNPCVVGSTRVFVADGRGSVEIRELAKEGKDVPVYCRDRAGNIQVRMMRNPRQTGSKQRILKVSFDSGRFVRVTENHEFILSNGELSKASRLLIGDCLSAAVRKKSKDLNQTQIMFRISRDESSIVREFNENTKIDKDLKIHVEDGQQFVYKTCEKCWTTSKVLYEEREKSFCSDKCAKAYEEGSKAYDSIEPFDQNFNTLKVVDIREDGYEDVYNGTVDQYHNYFIGGFLAKTESYDIEQYVGCLNCGEQWLFENESCNLGSINLAKFIKDKEVDYQRLKDVVESAVEFLDNVIDVNVYPLKQIKEMTLKTRKIGLGIMGLHDMLIQLEVPYDSEEGRETAYSVMKFVDEVAKTKSADLGEAYGYFPAFDSSINKYVGRRNAALTSIQPTGTVSMIADCSSGCEPYFSIVSVKNVLDGKKLLMINKHFEKVAKEEGFYTNELMKEIYKKGSVVGLDEIPEKWQRIFKAAQDISYEDHIRMQAVLQRAVDSSISKTINMRNSATLEDVERSYMLAYELGCKGITVYRDGSRSEQVLTVGTSGPVSQAVFQKLELPNVLDAKRYKLKDADGNSIYLIICFDEDENPMEVFAKFPYDNRLDMKDRSTMWTVVCRLVSLALRCKVPMKEIIKQLEKSSGNMFDLPAQLSKLLKSFMSETHFGYTTKCPDCGGVVEFKEGCESCSSCGYSKCS